MKKHVFFLLLVFGVTRFAYAGGETFPPDHWANKVVRTIISAGYLKSLQSMPRPLERQDVAQALFSFDKSNLSDPVILSLISKLETELNTELNELLRSFHPVAKMHIKVEAMGVLESRQTPPATETLIPESRLYKEVANIPFGIRSKNRVSLGFSFQKEFGIYASAILRQQGGYDESYSPSYSVFQLERGYMAYVGSVFRAKLGRDYIDWGYGASDLGMSNLGLSYYQRPLNHLMLQFNSEPVKFTYILAHLLEPNTGNTSGILSAGRFDFSVQSENFGFLLGVWQTALQNTNTASIDWGFIVPLNVYASHVPNSSQLINTNTGFDVLFSYSGVRIYGSFVLNVMGQSTSLVEQSLTWMAGFKMSNLFQFASVYGTELLAEIGTSSPNVFSVYGSKLSYFQHNDYWIGHPLGYNFIFANSEVSHWVTDYLHVSLFFSYVAPRSFDNIDNVIFAQKQRWSTGVNVFFSYWRFLESNFKLAYVYYDNKTISEPKEDFQVRLNVSVIIDIFLTLLEDK